MRIVLVQETASILLCKDSCEAPRRMVKWLDISNVDDEQISWLTPLNIKRSSQIVNLGEINITNIVSIVSVANLSSGPVETLYLDGLSRLHRTNAWDSSRQYGIAVTVVHTYCLGANGYADRLVPMLVDRKRLIAQF